MADYCQAKGHGKEASLRCAACQRPGKKVDPITVKALLRPEALAGLSASGHRFFDTPSCPVVHFAEGETFRAGNRTVCYCFASCEAELRREMEGNGTSTAVARVTAHVKAGRCACEIKNPQGSCCLGNLRSVAGELRVQHASPNVNRTEQGP